MGRLALLDLLQCHRFTGWKGHRRQSFAHSCWGLSTSEMECIWTSPPAPQIPSSSPFAFLQGFLSRHFLVLNQQMPLMSLDLLGVYRITLIHYNLASLYDFLVVFLANPFLYRKLWMLAKYPGERARNPALPGEASAWSTIPSLLFSCIISLLLTCSPGYKSFTAQGESKLFKGSESLKVRCVSSSPGKTIYQWCQDNE